MKTLPKTLGTMKFEPIALRAWDPKAQVMHNFNEGIQPIVVWNGLIWMRMSGVTDAEGTEAGEGDIVSQSSTEGVVRFFRGSFLFYPHNPLLIPEHVGSSPGGVPIPFHILGNIFTGKRSYTNTP